MLKALREIHHLSIPKSPSARRSRPALEQRPSQEALLPNAQVSAGYGTGAIPSNNEEESTVEDFLDSEDTTHSPSGIAPQTIETAKDPKGTEGKERRKTQDQKQKPLSIA